MGFRISLIICTKDRVQSLERCLLSLNGEEILKTKAEVVLVNNGSVDNSEDIIQKFKLGAKFPIKTIYEGAVGHSHARNSGIRASAGEIIAFTDDDCYPAEGFFKVITAAFNKNQFSYCGGQIYRFDPDDSEYTCNYQNTFELIPPYSFILAGKIQGTNMIFNREVINAIGDFDLRLGEGASFRCDDIDYVARASWAGFWGAHVPDIIIYHHHGRKTTLEIDKLKKINAYGEGAYVAKNILKGRIIYLRESIRFRKHRKYNLECVKGGVHYVIQTLLIVILNGFRVVFNRK